MANVARIIGKIVSVLPKTEGAKGGFTLSRKQLVELAKRSGDDKTLKAFLSKKPEISSLDLAYKSKSNYSIGAFRVMAGKTPYATGAVSVTNPGTTRSVIKARVSVGENGKIGQANGFIDAGKHADVKDAAMSLSYKGGASEVHLSSGKAFAANVKTNEDAVVNELKPFYKKEVLKKYSDSTRSLQRTLNQFMTAARQTLSGKYKGSIKEAITEKEPLKFQKFTPELKNKTIDNAKINKQIAELDKTLAELKINKSKIFNTDKI